jgi:hypothetical protein
MAACCLLVYLLVVPSVLRTIESDYQSKMEYVRDPQAYYTRLAEAEVATRSDPAAMQQIQTSVAQTIAFEESAQEQAADEGSTTDP